MARLPQINHFLSGVDGFIGSIAAEAGRERKEKILPETRLGAFGHCPAKNQTLN
jgi:hypothetical protein